MGFYVQAFDCRESDRQRLHGAAFERLMGVRGGATAVTLQLGVATIEILEFDRPGRPYVPKLSPYDGEFQHFALVVADMERAFARLSSVGGWTAITRDGPQRLPASSGGVQAFKFRDPDGHPLELLSFERGALPERWRDPPNGRLFQGIDHSALSCANAATSIAFYGSMGLAVAGRSFNHGLEQERLDGVSAPRLDVIALAPAIASPHVELLCYRERESGRLAEMQSNDVAATRIIFRCDGPLSSGGTERLMLDPDGHHVLVSTT